MADIPEGPETETAMAVTATRRGAGGVSRDEYLAAVKSRMKTRLLWLVKDGACGLVGESDYSANAIEVGLGCQISEVCNYLTTAGSRGAGCAQGTSMAAVIKPGSSRIVFGAYPRVHLPSVKSGDALFRCSEIETTGSVTIAGSAPAAGWQLGFIQVEWLDTSWLYYRGRQNNHGSIFFQRSRPPTRPVRACRDVDPETEIFYDPPDKVSAADALPKTLTIQHYDKPGDSAKAVVKNSLTGEDNFLREAQLGFLFCTVLTARDPAGNYHHLKSFYWNVRWQARFQPHNFSSPLHGWFVVPIAGGQGSGRSVVIEGSPTDPRFKNILTDQTVRGCNAIIPFYSPPPDGIIPVGNPNRRESRVWQDFDVRI